MCDIPKHQSSGDKSRLSEAREATAETSGRSLSPWSKVVDRWNSLVRNVQPMAKSKIVTKNKNIVNESSQAGRGLGNGSKSTGMI
jgi:hypothetical protein